MTLQCKNEINRIRESLITEINTLFRLENKRVDEQRGLLINDTKKQWSINITILDILNKNNWELVDFYPINYHPTIPTKFNESKQSKLFSNTILSLKS